MNRVPELVKLPVWRIVRASYLVFVYNPKLSLKLVAIPLAAFIFQVPMLRWMTDSIDLQSGIFTWQVAVVAAYSLLVSALTIPMITAWHRLVLYGHGHPEARLTYSIYSTEWSYLWKIVLYSFVIFGLAIVVAIGLTPFGMIGASLVGEVGDRTGTLDGSPESNRKIFKFAEAATKFVIWGVIIASTILTARISLVFPATAVGQEMRFRDSWARTRGNTWRLLAVLLICVAPFAYFEKIIGMVFNALGHTVSAGSAVAIDLISVPVWIIGLCVGVSCWSWSYRYLIQNLSVELPND